MISDRWVSLGRVVDFAALFFYKSLETALPHPWERLCLWKQSITVAVPPWPLSLAAHPSPSEDIGTRVNINSMTFLFVWCLPTKVLVHHLGFITLSAGGLGAVGRKPHSPDELITFEPISTNFFLASFLYTLIKEFSHAVRIRFKPSLFRGAHLSIFAFSADNLTNHFFKLIKA